MMDPVSLATAALAVLSPYLVDGGKEVTKTVAKDIYTSLKGKLTGRAAEALNDFEKAPTSEDNWGDLRKQLIKALEADPQLREELRLLLPKASVADGPSVPMMMRHRPPGSLDLRA
jgi:hypothetical protein